MKKKTVFVALLSLFIFPSCTLQKSAQAKTRTFPTESFVQIVKILEIKECKPKTPCKPGKFVSTGSGSVVGHHKNGNIILTAGHVCNTLLNSHYQSTVKDHDVGIYIVTLKNKHYKASLINHTYKKGNSQDLCLLYAKGPLLPRLRIASEAPKIGADVYSMAAPAGIFHPPTVPLLRGIYSGLMPDKVNAMMTIPAVGGSSGAPVLNDKMELVGMIHAAVREFHHVSISIGYSDLRKYLSKNISEFKKK